MNGDTPPRSPRIVVTEQPPSILKTQSPSLSSDSTGSFAKKRMSLGDMRALSIGRTETTDSRWSADERDSASNSSASADMCPLPESSQRAPFPFFSMTLSGTATLSFIALPVHLRPAVVRGVQAAWKAGIRSMDSVEYQPELMEFHRRKGCDGGVWELTMKVS
jgi:hypothetical protein